MQLCELAGAVALVDDSPTYCEQCAAGGIAAVLFGRYGWNEEHPTERTEGVHRAFDWSEVCRVLTSLSI
jgi:hypothetical protein